MLRLPVYLALDLSISRSHSLPDTERAIKSLVEVIQVDLILNDLVMLSILGFSFKAKVLSPLSPLDEVAVPPLVSEGATTFGPILDLLLSSIRSDVSRLRTEGSRVFRPLVFFFTDGAPTDSTWEASLSELEQDRYHPTIIAVGDRNPDPEFLRRLAGVKGRAFVLSATLGAHDSVRVFFDGLRSTLKSTTASSVRQNPGDSVPVPSGWIDVTPSPI